MTSGATRVLDLINWSGSITTQTGRWVIGGAEVPLDPVLTILLGPNVSVPAAALQQCAGYGISVLLCDWRGVPISAAHPWSSNAAIGRRAAAQASLSLPRRKNAWMRLVRAKVRNQAWCLDHHDRPATAQRLRTLANKVTSGDPTNVEAQAARIYWRALLSNQFRRDPGSHQGINAGLDYGYAILRGAVLREVVAAGLVPALGFHHHGPRNPFNLVDDLIEPFRPIVDRLVRDVATTPTVDSPLTGPIKRTIVAAVTVDRVWPSATGQVATPTGVRLFTQQVAAYVLGERAVLAPPVLT